MYRESEKARQGSLYSGNAAALAERSQRLYEEKSGWHHQFRREVTDRVDESVFKPLYNGRHGAPNAPLRVLVGMHAIKEGHGISDEMLFEQARFNMLIRSALGLINLEDEPPTESTYYLFRRRVMEYEEKTGKNLLEEAFEGITQGQCREYSVQGKRVRMDSKLMGSNIAYYRRYEVVHATIRKYARANKRKAFNLPPVEQALLKEVCGEDGHTVMYRSTSAEVERRLRRLGELGYWLLKEEGAERRTKYDLLKRVLEEQYEIIEHGIGGGKKKHVVRVRPKVGKKDKTPPDAPETSETADAPATPASPDAPASPMSPEASASPETPPAAIETPTSPEMSIPPETAANTETPEQAEKPEETVVPGSKKVQNPHDPECEHREKAGKQMKGYGVNITETCDENGLRLIVGVQTEGAAFSDQAFFQEGLEKAQRMVCGKIEEAYTDGGFHSPDNQRYCAEHGIDWTLRGIGGKPSRYDLSFDNEGNLKVKNLETGEELEAVRAKTKDPSAPARWRVKDGDHAPVYFGAKDVETCALRKRLAEIPKERLNIRNNVEATIFQVGYHYRGNKSRYRGRMKHQMWALGRCLWVNFRRISLWLERKEEERCRMAGFKPFVFGLFEFLFLPAPRVSLAL